MDAFTQLFDHHASYRIIICRACAFAVQPNHIVTHLKSRHPQVPAAERGDILVAARQLRDLAWHRGDLRLPRVAEAPIPGLVDGTDGLVCQWEECMYTCTTKQGITSHCKQQHGWTNEQKRGGDARKKSTQPGNRLWAENQPYQRVFRASGWPAYVALRAAVCQRDVGDLYEQVKTERKRIEDEEAAAAAHDTIKEGIRQLPDPWLELTGWRSHLKGRGRAELLAARLPPVHPSDSSCQEPEAEDEAALRHTCDAMRRLISRAFKVSRPEEVGRAALEVVERRETGAESNEKPFYSNQKSNTIRRYSEKLVSVICYLWRSSDTAQPAYRLSHNQEAYITEIRRTARLRGRQNRELLETACLRFWMSLLDHDLPDDEYKNALLSGVVVLGLKPDHLGGGWYPAHEFSPVLSALITTSKALTLYAAYQEHVDCRANADGVDASPSIHELVRDKAERFLQLSSFQGIVGPMNRMLRLRTLARTLANQRNTSGLVSWDGDKILIDRQSFTMADLQGMIKGLCETARQQLLTDVLLLDTMEDGRVRAGSTALPPLSMDSLVDQPSEEGAGFSFLKHPDNHFDAWDDWLLRRVMHEPALTRRFRSGASSEQWCDSAVHAYMKGVRRFKEALFALVHLSAGAPARGTEITSILCENDASGVGYRGVFVEGGLVAFVTTYHKGYSFSKQVKTIHRYVPREVSELVVYFLALARPFITDLQKLHCGVRGCTSFLWEPLPEQEERIDGGIDSAETEEEEDDYDDAEEESEAGDRHRRPARAGKPRSANPDGYWGTDRIRRVLREYTGRFLGATLGTRSWRHAYPAIHRNLGTDSNARDVLDMLYWNKEMATNDARALQSGHTLRTEESGYGRLLLESPNQTHRERQQFRGVSVDWHRLLGFTSAWKGDYTHMVARQEEQASARWAALAKADLKAAFRALTDKPDAEFRSKQEEAFAAIAQRRLRVLVVMATGSGKSLLFMLPAAIVGTGVTIVIAPLNALCDDLLDRCEKMGIKAARWEGKRPPYWASIVVVTPESAVSPSFGRFIDEKRTMRELDRIVIDECHVLMESSETWRPDVLKLTQMTEKATQVIYLTATLPPTLQPTFMQVAGLDDRSLTVCRDPHTTRPNIAYRLVEYTREELDDTLVRLVAEKRAQYGEEAQVIVYCRRVKETRRLATLLKCAAYFSEMGTEAEKSDRVRAFTRGLVKICTATNMLGLGVDAAAVRVVIHVDMCLKMEQFAQESGRAGRSSLPSESLVLTPVWRTKTGETERPAWNQMDAPVKEFLTGTVCRRIAIDSHMDARQDRQQCEVGEAMCDLCSVRTRGTKRLVAPAEEDVGEQATRRKIEAAVSLEQRQIDIRERRKMEQRGLELEQLDKHLSRWRGVCVLCMARAGVRESHSWEHCPHHHHTIIRSLTLTIKHMETGPWQLYARCEGCSAPQAICDRWAETDTPGLFMDRGPDQCQYKGVLLPAVASMQVLDSDRLKRWMLPIVAEYGLPTVPFRIGNISAAMGKKVKLGQRDTSQMARFFHAWNEGLA